VLRRLVLSVPGHAVAWEAVDGDDAVAKAAADRPDVVLMDLVMPRVDGVEATRQIMKRSPCPILVVTSTIPGNYDLVIRAMGAGALGAAETPTLGPDGMVRNGRPLLDRLAKLEAASRGGMGSGIYPVARLPGLTLADRPPLVVVGSSTGGPDALAAVLGAFRADFPAAVLVAQHIDAEFAPGLVSWLAARCRLSVRAAQDGMAPEAGRVYVAATNDHLEVGPDTRLRYTAHPRGLPYRPSADVLFASAAAVWPRRGVGVLLTGMGADGADGLLQLRSAGWHTVAQDESTCVVYGMPKAAAEKGAAVEVLPLPLIGPAVAAKVPGPKR
jgi:two-component system response regulator WspF